MDADINSFMPKRRGVLEGKSKTYENWQSFCGISKEDFIEGLKWLCDDPCNGGFGDGLTRELGVDKSGTTYRLRRVYYSDKTFAGFYREDNGALWISDADHPSISARDRT